MINTFNKSVYFFENYSAAIRSLLEFGFRTRSSLSDELILSCLQSMWEAHVKWYNEVYPVKYRESLTLEQLARFHS